MPIIDLRDLRIIEENSSFKYADFTVFMDEPAGAPVTFSYYTQDGSATGAYNDSGESRLELKA
jgi:hypothetical protein